MEKYKITYQGKEIEIERLPNGRFKIPPLGQFTKHGLGSTWLDEGRIPYESDKDKEHRQAVVRQYDNKGMYGGNSYLESKTRMATGGGHNQGRFPANLCCSSRIDVNIEALLEAKHKLT